MKIRSKTPATLNMGTTGLLIVTSIIISSSILLIAIWMIQPPICDRLELTQTAIQTYSLLREIALNLRSQPPRYIDREQCILMLSKTLQLINQSLKDRGMHLTVDSILVTQDLQTTVEYTVWQGENYVTTTLTTGKGGYSVDLQPDTLQVDIPTRPFTVNLTFTVINTGIRVESVRLTGDNVQAAYYQGQDPRVQVQGASILIENLQPGEAILGLILEFHVPQGLTTSIAEAIVEESEFSDYTYISWTQGEQWLSLNEQLDLHAGPYPSISTVGSRQGWSNLIWDYQTWSGAWGGYVDPDGGYAGDWYDNLNPDQGNHNVYPTHGGQLYYDPTTQRWYEITDDGTVYVPGGESGFPPSASGREVGRLVRVIWVPGYGLMEVPWDSDAVPFIGEPVSTQVFLQAGYAYATYNLQVEGLQAAYLNLSLQVNGTVRVYINGVEWNPMVAQPGVDPYNITGLLHEGDNTIMVVLLSDDWPGEADPWSGSAEAQGTVRVRLMASSASLQLKGRWESGVPTVHFASLVSNAWIWQYSPRTWANGQYTYHLRLYLLVRDLGNATLKPNVYMRATGSVSLGPGDFMLEQDAPPGGYDRYMATLNPAGGDTITVTEHVTVYVPSPSLDKIYYDTATAGWSYP